MPDEKMHYYEDLAEMYVGDDVSPDFYGWVFPKCDHVAVGTGTVINKPSIKKYQTATRYCCTCRRVHLHFFAGTAAPDLKDAIVFVQVSVIAVKTCSGCAAVAKT